MLISMKPAYLYGILLESGFQRNKNIVQTENHKMTSLITVMALWLPVLNVDIL